MSSTPDPGHISGRHRDTLLQIFEHPTSHNVEWHAARSLLEAVGSVDRRHDDKFVVHVGDEKEVVTPPKGKDLDVQQVLDLRRMLTAAGYAALAEELRGKGKEV